MDKKVKNRDIEYDIGKYVEYLRFEKLLLPNTIDSYSRDLKKFNIFLKDNNIIDHKELEKEQILNFLKSLHTDQSESSISRVLSTLRSFYKFLVSEGICRRNPWIEISNPVRPRKMLKVLNVEEVKDSLKLYHPPQN